MMLYGFGGYLKTRFGGMKTMVFMGGFRCID